MRLAVGQSTPDRRQFLQHSAVAIHLSEAARLGLLQPLGRWKGAAERVETEVLAKDHDTVVDDAGVRWWPLGAMNVTAAAASPAAKRRALILNCSNLDGPAPTYWSAAAPAPARSGSRWLP